jgi:energy-coupling factor transport system ATP-binding protein
MRTGTPARVTVEGFSWTPLGARRPILDGIDLRIEPGERVLLVGPSGGGKSTLLRAIAGVLTTAEDGDLAGAVTVDGDPARAGRAAMVLQDPGAGIVGATIGRDVAFGPENHGLPREEIWRRVEECLAVVSLPYPVDRSSRALSGGETQRLALAGAIAVPTGLLLLDEPTSMLDRDASHTVREAVRSAVADRTTTMIVAEHRLEGWLDLVERVVVIADGRIIADGPVRQVLHDRRDELLTAGIWVPGATPPEPLAVPLGLCAPARRHTAGTELLSAVEVCVTLRGRRGLRVSRTPPASTIAVSGASATLRAGELTLLHGPSGSGKSTLLSTLTGLVRPDEGTVTALPPLARDAGNDPSRWPSAELARRVGWVPQRPTTTVAGQTCRDSALATARILGRGGPGGARDRTPREAADRVDALFDVLGLSAAAGRHPYLLSGGEGRRLALATALAHSPELVVLDEPTVGQDRNVWAAVAGVACSAAAAGAAVIAASHDAQLMPLATSATTMSAVRR